MLGLMMDTPLLVSGVLEHASAVHGRTEIVARTLEGGIRRCTYAEAAERCKRIAAALIALGIRPGDRVGSLAWNTIDHFELFYAVPGISAVLHTINPRLHDDQIAFIAAHAGDSLICVDAATLPIAERIVARIPNVRAWIFLSSDDSVPSSRLPNFMSMERLLAAHDPIGEWPTFDERQACTICYTSGTTGQPKGVVYSHRSTVLSAMLMSMADMIGGYVSGGSETFMPIAPLFHANGWQMPFTAPMNGHRLVLPGRNFEPENLYALMAQEEVTVAAAVPTVWLALVEYLDRHRLRLPALRAAMVAGTKAPRTLIEVLEDKYGVTVGQSWGMTEAPGVMRATMPWGSARKSADEQIQCKLRQGRIGYGTQLRLVDDAGRSLPNDGVAMGHLEVRGFCVASGYYKQPSEAGWAWLSTGDVARIFPDGTVEIVDRSKDVIKSGGEWISSVAIENAALEHPAVRQAAVIGIEHPRWQERPLLIVVKNLGSTATPDEILAHIGRVLPKWWRPDKVVFAEELPTTATGKIQKSVLRERYRIASPEAG